MFSPCFSPISLSIFILANIFLINSVEAEGQNEGPQPMEWSNILDPEKGNVVQPQVNNKDNGDHRPGHNIQFGTINARPKAALNPWHLLRAQYNNPFITPIFRKLQYSEFLHYEEEEIGELQKFGNKKCACGKHLLRDMQKIKYGDWHFRVRPEPLGAGTTSNVFHAHAMSELKDFDGKPIKLEHCVALKSVLLAKAGLDFEQEMRNELAILKEFAKIKAKRVIRLFAFQDIPQKRQLIFVMELGEMNLESALMGMEKVWENNTIGGNEPVGETIQATLVEILEVVKEMHKLIMHLDLKPQNMLYVKEADGKGGHRMVLKAIDFGGSELIPTAGDAKMRANVCKLRPTSWMTQTYASPEQMQYCSANPGKYAFTIKCDIWSVGVMLLQMMLSAPSFKGIITIGGNERLWMAIDGIVNYYRSGDDHTQRVDKYVLDIVRMALNQYPQLFDIITATLNKTPTERPTARGLIDYLSGNCQLKLPKEIEAFVQAQFFSGLNSRSARVLLKLANKLESDGHAMERLERFLDGPPPLMKRAAMTAAASGKRFKRQISPGGLPECDMQTTGHPSLLSNENSAEGRGERGPIQNLMKNGQQQKQKPKKPKGDLQK